MPIRATLRLNLPRRVRQPTPAVAPPWIRSCSLSPPVRWPGRPLCASRRTRSDPGEVAASTASETRRDDLPSNARRRPSHSMHFGAQSRGLRAPCERFAPGVTPGPRITRFRLAADLGRMGLDTHRVSNKVSKITSRHLVPLDRAFPAHALLHGRSCRRARPDVVYPLRCDRTPREGAQADHLVPEQRQPHDAIHRCDRRTHRRDNHGAV